MTGEETGDAFPVRRPHFVEREGDLFFLESRRPFRRLTSAERTVWSRADGATRMGSVTGGEAQLQSALEALERDEILDVIEPVTSTRRRRILVIEPHMDDAVLSVGGTMWQQRRTCFFTVATMAGESNFTSYYYSEREYFDPKVVSALRKAESAHVMRMLGGRHLALPHLEAPLRCRSGTWSRDWYASHTKLVDSSILRAPSSRETEEWASSIRSLLTAEDFDEVWIPIGIAAHVDHELTRNAALTVLIEDVDVAHGATVLLYAEVPYLGDAPDRPKVLEDVFTDAGARLVSQRISVAESMPTKQRLVNVFGSQFKPKHMSPRVLRAAHVAAPDGDPSELFWRVDAPPGSVDPVALHAGRLRVESLAPRLAAWIARNRGQRRVRVLCGDPIPRGIDDMTRLGAAFPDATLEVHVRSSQWPEGESHPRLHIENVEAGSMAWPRRITSLVGSTDPVLILTGLEHKPWHHLVGSALVRADTCVATTISDTVLALDAETR